MRKDSLAKAVVGSLANAVVNSLAAHGHLAAVHKVSCGGSARAVDCVIVGIYIYYEQAGTQSKQANKFQGKNDL